MCGRCVCALIYTHYMKSEFICIQVPQDEWGGRDEEIPCRRMRSSSYVKAMGDQDSGDSDGSPKNSPQKSVRPDALVKSVLQRQLSDQR